MKNSRRGVIGIGILIAVVITALLAGVEAQKAFSPHGAQQNAALATAGRDLGGIIAGPPGAAIGENLGYLLALALGVTAAQRHGAATAAAAQVKVLSATPAAKPGA